MNLLGETYTTEQLRYAFKMAFYRFTPQAQFRNPIIFVTYLAALLCWFVIAQEAYRGIFSPFHLQITLWLSFTVLFANLALALAESRGQEQAANLRKSQIETTARVMKDGGVFLIPAAQLRRGDIVICEATDIIPADGEIIDGMATIDESAITGESAPVIRESGKERSAVTSGTQVVNDRVLIRVTAERGDSFFERMIQLIEIAKWEKSPNQIAMNYFLSMLGLTMVVVVATLKIYTDYAVSAGGVPVP